MSRSYRKSHPKGQNQRMKRLGKRRWRMLDRMAAHNGDPAVPSKGVVNQDIYAGYMSLDLDSFPHSYSK